MKIKYKKTAIVVALLIGLQGFTQENEVVKEEENVTQSNIQTYTPSKLLNKGQWDIKFFNSIYTQTKKTDSGSKSTTIPRENFFTSTAEVFTGISDNNRINVGAILEFRSNTFDGRQALSVFSLENTTTDRKGLSTIAPAIKFQPLKNVANFSVQSAIHIPLHSEEVDANGAFLDQTAWAFQNRFFYDYTLKNGKWQVFTELNTEYNFGDEDSFADNTFVVAPGAFLSYFPSNKSTILGFVQHNQRFGDFEQNGTSAGFGGKYQLSKMLNIEALYSNIFRGENFQGLGSTYSIGLRALF